MPTFTHLRLEAPELLGIHFLLRIGLNFPRTSELGTSQMFRWYPQLQLRASPTRLSRGQSSRTSAPDRFRFLAEPFDELPLAIPPPFVPIESSFSDGPDAQLLARAFTVGQPWDPRLGFALLPVPQGLLGGMLIASPSPFSHLEEHPLTIDGAAFSRERIDTGRLIAPDFMREAEPF